uniref:Metallo-beta-lactamase domain protein n=1 Tax=Toxoplasma gondii COUG TaxID=1074873 RepID=A0A2G8YBV7_TOXGO|nr:metallo-beta-lactamase domain protein [Toxoplasma gondii COUG]
MALHGVTPATKSLDQMSPADSRARCRVPSLETSSEPTTCPLSAFASCASTPLFASISLSEEEDTPSSRCASSAPRPRSTAPSSVSSLPSVSFEVEASSSAPSRFASCTQDGLLFLGTGVSCALPQLGHVLPMASPSHPFFPLLHLPPGQLPSSRELHRLAAQQTEDPQGCTAREKRLREAEPAGGRTPETKRARDGAAGQTSGGEHLSACAESRHAETDAVSESNAPPREAAARDCCSEENCTCGQKQEKLEDGGHGVSCVSCFLCWKNEQDENRRNNVSAVLRIAGKRILIDCGKTFRQAALAYFPLHQITTLDAVLLTHDHQDAVGGIDDLRDLQRFTRPALLPPTTASGSGVCTSAPSSGSESAGTCVPLAGEENGVSASVASSNSLLEEKHLRGVELKKEEDRKALGYRPENLLPCYLGFRTLQSLCSKFKYIVQTSWRMQKALLDAREKKKRQGNRESTENGKRSEPGGATCETDAKKRGAEESLTPIAHLLCNNDSNVHEELLPGYEVASDCTDMPVLERKVACLAFHLINDTAPSSSFSSCLSSSSSSSSCSSSSSPPSPSFSSSCSAPAVSASRQDAQDSKPCSSEGETASCSYSGNCGVDLNCMWKRLPKHIADDAGFSTLQIPGVSVPIHSFPVFHGGVYVSLGFLVGAREKLVYISDVTSFPPPVLRRLRQIPDIETLVVDAIGEKLHNAHFSLQEALALAVLLQPRKVFFVGMSCSLEHRKTNRRLALWLRRHREVYVEREGRESRIENVSLAVDGLFVPMQF